MGRFCTDCGAELDDGDHFCKKCGAKIDASRYSNDEKHSQDPEKLMGEKRTCPKCLTVYEEDLTHCPKCGLRLCISEEFEGIAH